MIDKFFLFSDMNRNSTLYSVEDAFAVKGARIVAMGDEEDAYLFSMQLLLGSAEIVSFEKFHDDYWPGKYRDLSLSKYLSEIIFCTDPRFLDYMCDFKGVEVWKKNVREKAHWAKPSTQLNILKGFY